MAHLNCGKQRYSSTSDSRGNRTVTYGVVMNRQAAGPGASSSVSEVWIWDGEVIASYRNTNIGSPSKPYKDQVKKDGKVYKYGERKEASGGSTVGRFVWAIKECTKGGDDGGGGGGGNDEPKSGCNKPHWAIFELCTQVNEGSYYEGLITRSSDSAAEHQISYVNETKSPKEIVDYPEMTMMGLSLRATREFNNLDQPRVYLKGGLKVNRLTGGTGTSNNYADLIYWLLTNKDAGAGEVVNEAMIDEARMTTAAKFLDKIGLTWDGSLSEKTNLRSFASTTAPFFLCNFTITNGKFTLWPVIPVANNGTFKGQKAYIKQIFTEGNIIDGSFDLNYLDADDRRPFKAAMRYRVMYENQVPEERTLTARWYTGDFSDPTEDFDMTQFCTTPEHALLAARYFMWIRNVVTHSVKFQTVPEVMNGVGPGDFIKVRMETGALRQRNVGAITAEGFLYSADPWPDGVYAVNYWVAGMIEPDETSITLVNGQVQESGYTGALISLRPSTDDCDTADSCYQVESVNLEDDGLVEVTASYYPLDDQGVADLYNALFGLGRWSRDFFCEDDSPYLGPCEVSDYCEPTPSSSSPTPTPTPEPNPVLYAGMVYQALLYGVACGNWDHIGINGDFDEWYVPASNEICLGRYDAGNADRQALFATIIADPGNYRIQIINALGTAWPSDPDDQQLVMEADVYSATATNGDPQAPDGISIIHAGNYGPFTDQNNPPGTGNWNGYVMINIYTLYGEAGSPSSTSSSSNSNPVIAFNTASSVYDVTHPGWGSFMNDYAIWFDPLIGAHDFAVTLNFPVTGTYTFISSSDNATTWGLNGASNYSTPETGYGTSVTETVSVSSGSNTINATVTNTSGSNNTPSANPGGWAMRVLNPDGTELWNTRYTEPAPEPTPAPTPAPTTCEPSQHFSSSHSNRCATPDPTPTPAPEPTPPDLIVGGCYNDLYPGICWYYYIEVYLEQDPDCAENQPPKVFTNIANYTAIKPFSTATLPFNPQYTDPDNCYNLVVRGGSASYTVLDAGGCNTGWGATQDNTTYSVGAGFDQTGGLQPIGMRIWHEQWGSTYSNAPRTLVYEHSRTGDPLPDPERPTTSEPTDIPTGCVSVDFPEPDPKGCFKIYREAEWVIRPECVDYHIQYEPYGLRTYISAEWFSSIESTPSSVSASNPPSYFICQHQGNFGVSTTFNVVLCDSDTPTTKLFQDILFGGSHHPERITFYKQYADGSRAFITRLTYNEDYFGVYGPP